MNDPLGVHANIRVLETGDALTAAVAVRKQRERIASKLLEEGIVVAA